MAFNVKGFEDFNGGSAPDTVNLVYSSIQTENFSGNVQGGSGPGDILNLAGIQSGFISIGSDFVAAGDKFLQSWEQYNSYQNSYAFTDLIPGGSTSMNISLHAHVQVGGFETINATGAGRALYTGSQWNYTNVNLTANSDYITATGGIVNAGGGVDYVMVATVPQAGWWPAATTSMYKQGGTFTINYEGGSQINVTNAERFIDNGMKKFLVLDSLNAPGQIWSVMKVVNGAAPTEAQLAPHVKVDMPSTHQTSDQMHTFAQTLINNNGGYLSAYGGNINTMSNSQFLTKAYDVAFHRAPDASGYDYWLNALNSNQTDKAGIIATFAESPEFVQMVGLQDAMIWVAM